MKCKNCKADNKIKSICDAGIVCYVLRCGEYGCALNGKTVNKLLRMKKATTNRDLLRAMTDDELAGWAAERSTAPNCTGKCHKDYEVYGELRTFCHACWLDWLKQEVQDDV